MDQRLPPSPSPATLEQRLLAASVQNSNLLQALSETDYATSACEQNSNYISKLQKQIAGHKTMVKQLEAIVADEYADHKKYRDRHFKRLSHWISGGKEKFEQKASKEEKEWLDAVQNEIRAKKMLDQLNLSLVEAEKTDAELQAIASVHTRAQFELNTLYNMLFQGPTPDIPEEDEKERAVQNAENNCNALQMAHSKEIQTRTLLLGAQKYLQSAVDDMRQAMSSSTADLWGVGGTFTEMAEGSALSRAEIHVDHFKMLMDQARMIQPAIREVAGPQIAQQNFMADIVFDNIFTDLDMRDKIRNSQQQLYGLQRDLTAELNRADERTNTAQAELRQAKTRLDGKRAELQRVRAAVFDIFLGHSAPVKGSEPLPPPPSVTMAPPSCGIELPPGYSS